MFSVLSFQSEKFIHDGPYSLQTFGLKVWDIQEDDRSKHFCFLFQNSIHKSVHPAEFTIQSHMVSRPPYHATAEGTIYSVC